MHPEFTICLIIPSAALLAHLIEGDKCPRFFSVLFNAQQFVGQPPVIRLTSQSEKTISITFLVTYSSANFPSFKNYRDHQSYHLLILCFWC